MRNKRKIPFISKPKLAIIVDGYTEYWYLKMIQRNEKNTNIDIKPEIPQKKTLIDQYNKVVDLSKIYDKVIWIIDLDVILKESKLSELLRYKKSIKSEFSNILMIINQPCLEYWILLHFNLTCPLFRNCGQAERLLLKYFSNYSKTEKFYTKQGNDIYLKLKDNLSNAITNSKKLEEFNYQSPYKGFTEMHVLFEELGIK